MVDSLFFSASTRTLGCATDGCSRSVVKKSRWTGLSGLNSPVIRTNAPSVRKAVFRAPNPSSLDTGAYLARYLSTISGLFSAAAARVETSSPWPLLPVEPEEERAGAWRPFTKTIVSQSSLQGATDSMASLMTPESPSGASPASANSARAIGATFVYFQRSLPLRAVGMPTSANRAKPASRRVAKVPLVEPRLRNAAW